ncbi:MAG: enoyl-CoA hydratase/isomerase family protein [Blastomonas fulva]
MDMPFERLTVDIRDRLARLEFNNAVRGNPIEALFCAKVCDSATMLSVDPAVRCEGVTAMGDAFGYGGDINSFVGDIAGLPANIKRWTTTLHSAVARLQRMGAPVVAAVHGICAGGMTALAAGADILVAAQDTKLFAAYTGIGFSCDAGSSIINARRIGAERARRFLLLGQTLDAQAVVACGLTDEVHDTAHYRARAEEIALRLAAGPTKAFGGIRHLMLSVLGQPPKTQLELEAQALSRTSGSKDAAAAIAAFTNRARPTFRGE